MNNLETIASEAEALKQAVLHSRIPPFVRQDQSHLWMQSQVRDVKALARVAHFDGSLS